MGDITQLIARAREGDRGALDSLFAAAYPDPDPGTTALINECYLKLRDASRLEASDRAHFFAYSAAAMRSIVIDIARAPASAAAEARSPSPSMTTQPVTPRRSARS